MKSTLLRLSVLLLTFTVGVTLPLFFKKHRSTKSCLTVPSSGVGSVEDYLVISVPSDTEFYLGQRKVALDEIPGGVIRVLGNQPVDNQVVIIKSAASIRFETLSLIANQVRNANVKRIEFVLDKRKRSEPLQSPPSFIVGCTLTRRSKVCR